MKKLILLSTFFISISVHALPNCPSDVTARWHNCFGTFNYTSGDKYVGEWRDDKRHGQGTFTFVDGNKYVGAYKDGLRNGQGTMTFYNGDKYVGAYKDDKAHGRGTYTFANGSSNDGYFMENDYIPDICEKMGLVKGTESFGDCVNNLINDL